MIANLQKSIDRAIQWVETHNFKAYDPGDGSLSFLRHFTFGSHFLNRLLTGAVLRSPVHIRPWIGIPPHTSTKGMGYMGWASAKLHALTGEDSHRVRAEYCFEWLMKHRSPGPKQYCWGNHFGFSTRAGTIPAHAPTVVWSSLIGLAFLEGYEVLCDSRYLDVAASIAEWVKLLPREQTRDGVCISYVPFAQRSIHNSNMLAASLLASVSAHTNDESARDLASEAMAYSCARQQADGAWFYGEEAKYHWIDSFHTGYNLDSLKRYGSSTGDQRFAANIRNGFEYFRENFFLPSGFTKYYHNEPKPLDIQCCAQAIDTLAFFSEYPGSLQLAQRVADWTVAHMQNDDGHFYYRDLGWKLVKTPMFHWGQGTMIKALAHLLYRSASYEAAPSNLTKLEMR
jgi:hypothetical protein